MNIYGIEIDIAIIIYAFLGILVGIIVGFFVGKWNDPYWRCIQMRKWTKQPYIVANLKRKDGVLIMTTIVNTMEDIIVIGQNMWIVKQGTIYLKTDGKIRKENRIKLTDEMIQQELGAPCVYLNMDDLVPISLDPQRPPLDGVKPNELGPTMLAWVANQYLKALAGNKSQGILMILIAIGALGAAALGYMNMQATQIVKDQIASLNSKVDLLTQANPNIQNGTIVIHVAGSKVYLPEVVT